MILTADILHMMYQSACLDPHRHESNMYVCLQCFIELITIYHLTVMMNHMLQGLTSTRMHGVRAIAYWIILSSYLFSSKVYVISF